jgi:site-specific DNA recombinase
MSSSTNIIESMEEAAIIINRISSQRQDEGYSLSQQSLLNNEKAKNDGRKVIKEFFIIESAKKSEKRDEFREIINFIKKNKIKYVYIEKPDRLTRNIKDTAIAYDLVYDSDITFIFTRDNFILNKNSGSHSKFQFDIKAVMAKNYIDNLSDEVKKGQRGMLDEGRWPGGSSPTGYKKIDKLLVPDEPRATFVIKTFETYASGAHSLKSLKKEMDKQGFRSINGRLLSRSNYHIILTNPIYYGTIRWNKNLYEGRHEPLIDKQLFDKVQEMLSRTKNGEVIPVYAKHDITYRGNLVCGECGCKITAEEKTKTNKGNGKVHRWVYYHCTHFKECSQIGSVREEIIEEQIIEFFNSLSLGENTTAWLKEKLKESHSEEIKFRESSLIHLNNSLMQIRKRLDRVYDDKIDGVIDEDTYTRKREEYLTHHEDLKNQIKNHEIADKKYVDFGCLVLDIANRAGEIYKVRNAQDKRYLLNLVFSNLLLKDKKVQFSLKNIFQAVSSYQKTKDWLPSQDSNLDKQIQSLLSYH